MLVSFILLLKLHKDHLFIHLVDLLAACFNLFLQLLLLLGRGGKLVAQFHDFNVLLVDLGSAVFQLLLRLGICNFDLYFFYGCDWLIFNNSRLYEGVLRKRLNCLLLLDLLCCRDLLLSCWSLQLFRLCCLTIL